MRRSLFRKLATLGLLACGFCAAQEASAAIVISEYVYSGLSGEFVEFTNTGNSAIDMTGWSFDDNTQLPGSFSLSAFGTVGVGESVILCEPDEALFRTAWSLAGTVKVIGLLDHNLGRADEINVYDATNTLVDRLTFGDNTIGGPRAQNASANPLDFSILGTNTITSWQLATVGDQYGSYASADGDIANPGINNLTAVPEPGTFAALALGSLLVGAGRRARQRRVLHANSI